MNVMRYRAATITMKAVILAAGKGTRMKPFTDQTPKPLAAVRGKTFLEHIVDALDDVADEIIVIIGYRGEQIKAHLTERYPGRAIRYVTQETLNGTGPALHLARPFLPDGERFFIFYADEFVTKKEIDLCLTHEFAWLSRRATHPERSGVMTLDDGGRIIRVVEKPEHPESNTVVAGVMLVNTDVFRHQPAPHPTGEFYLTSILDAFIRDHDMYAVPGIDDLSFSTVDDVEAFNRAVE